MFSPRSRTLFALTVLLVAVTARAQTAAPAANPPETPAPATTTAARPTTATVGPINFGDITTDAALDMLERWSGRTVLRPAGLPATSLHFTLNQKVAKAEALAALETLLTLNGIGVTPLGDKFLKVTPLNTARTEAPDFIEGSTLGLPASGHLAQKVFTLKFLRVGEFMPQIAGLLNPAAASPPLLFEKTNAALITDTVSNLQRIETLINQLDQPSLGGMTAKFYKVQNTTASELVTKLQAILTGNSATQLGTGTSFQADDRTNQIILLSDPRQFPFFDELIAKLDTAGESSTRQEVIPLKHAVATDMATVLSTLISGQNAAARTANQAAQTAAATRTAANAFANAARTNGTATTVGANGANNGVRPGNGQPAAATANVNRAPIAFAGPNGTVVFQGGTGGADTAPQQFSSILTVVADDRSNSLIVSGTVDDMRLIKDIIAQLDVLLGQVRIEVVIAEITLDDAATSGLDSLGLVVSNNRLVGFNVASANGSIGGTPGATGIGATYTTLYNATTNVRDLAGTLSVITTPRKTNTRILSVPSIVTTHNKEATVFVGEQVPTISSYQNTGTGTSTVGAGYTSNVTQQKIGITLTVKPLIGNDGSVQLDITQEVNDILGQTTLDGNQQPIVGSRTMTSFVSVNSGEIIVLGGLQRKLSSLSTNRLGPIPILGDLFGKRTTDNTRTDLVFFLRPYVLTNTAQDNTEALARLKLSPQHDDVQAALKGTLPFTKP